MKPTKHQQQIFFQVFLPFALVFLIVAAILVLLFLELPEGNLDYRNWSNISILVISFPLILLSVVVFFGTCIAIYFNFIIKQKFMKIVDKLSGFSSKCSKIINKISALISTPVIQIGSVFSPSQSNKMESTGKYHE